MLQFQAAAAAAGGGVVDIRAARSTYAGRSVSVGLSYQYR